MEITYGKRLDTNQIIHLDRRNMDPSVQKLPKKACPPEQDIVQVTLPWLDEANDCIEVYIVREANGEIRLECD